MLLPPHIGQNIDCPSVHLPEKFELELLRTSNALLRRPPSGLHPLVAYSDLGDMSRIVDDEQGIQLERTSKDLRWGLRKHVEPSGAWKLNPQALAITLEEEDVIGVRNVAIFSRKPVE